MSGVRGLGLTMIELRLPSAGATLCATRLRGKLNGVMPLDSYTLIHRSAALKPGDIGTLCLWSGGEQQRLASLSTHATR